MEGCRVPRRSGDGFSMKVRTRNCASVSRTPNELASCVGIGTQARVTSAPVPSRYEFTECSRQEAPAAGQVSDETLCLVLREDGDAADAGIHAVREREVDVAEVAAEGKRRLAVPPGQLTEPRPIPSRQHQRQRVARELLC
jgi:hypothetical protein